MRGLRFHCILAGLALAAAPQPASAQDNLGRGKSPQQLFNTDCGICHRSVRGLGASMGERALSGFLTEHYSTSAAAARALAGYLTAAGGGAREGPSQRRRSRTPKDGKPKPD